MIGGAIKDQQFAPAAAHLDTARRRAECAKVAPPSCQGCGARGARNHRPSQDFSVFPPAPQVPDASPRSAVIPRAPAARPR
jgi:hypothetical protein